MSLAQINRFWRDIDGEKWIQDLSKGDYEKTNEDFNQFLQNMPPFTAGTVRTPKSAFELNQNWKLLQFAEDIRPPYFGKSD